VFHFLRFRGSKESAVAGKESKLPVLWHQCFLAFAERYMNDITEDQREALLDLLLVRGHRDMGPEIRRQLLSGRNRGEAEPIAMTKEDGDDTMDIS
jgi:essential nuclear protein 1